MLTIPQQFEELLKHPENILIMLKKNPLIADVAAATALKKILENSKKTVEIASENFRIASKMKFLPGLSEVKDNLSHLRKFVIRVDTSRTKVEELSYDQNGDHLDIFLMPSGGMFRKEDVETREGDFRFDLIVCVGSPDLESLGQLYEKNSEFFTKRRSSILTTNRRTSILGKSISWISPLRLRPKSFTRSPKIYGRSFSSGSGYAYSGRHDRGNQKLSKESLPNRFRSQAISFPRRAPREIIQHLYFTKSLSLLKLWGKILTRLQKTTNTA